MNNAKVNPDGSFTVNTDDPYNFEEWDSVPIRKTRKEIPEDLKHNITLYVNNNAHKQQQAGQLEMFLNSIPIHLTKEEIEDILRKYSI